jgi:hypothetical protein
MLSKRYSFVPIPCLDVKSVSFLLDPFLAGLMIIPINIVIIIRAIILFFMLPPYQILCEKALYIIFDQINIK